MDGDLPVTYWPELSDLYASIGNDKAYAESGDVEFDPRCPNVTDPSEFMGFAIPANIRTTPCSDMSYIHNLSYFSEDNTLAGQQQTANQQLYIDTQLSFSQFDESESSTTSSTSLHNLLRTPCIQFCPRPSIHIPSPYSSSAESGMLVPELDEMAPFPVSPSLTFEGDTSDDLDLASPLATGSDVVTQSPMSHILEWKRIIELCGTSDFVPQAVYQPHTEADKKRYIKEVELQQTICFGMDNSSEWGISLDDAVKQRLLHLKGKDDLMFVGCGPSVSIRIQWPGYSAWSKQIPTMDFKTPKGPITRAKLAKNIATCIRYFFKSVQDKPMEAESDTRWKIGQRHIRVEDLILVSLHHVSKGSWQPQLRCRRSLRGFPCHWDLPPVPVL